jgi:hypothetical protein
VAISIDTMKNVGLKLRSEAARHNHPVDDDSFIELFTYATQPILQDVDEKDLETVVEVIGRNALKEHRKLDVEAIRRTIRRICHPISPWRPCHNAARTILSNQGRTDAVDQIDTSAAELLKQLGEGVVR